MFSSHSTVFGIYTRRALIIMVLGILEALGSLLSFLYRHQLELGLYPVIVLFSWWFLNAQEDQSTTSEKGQNECSNGGLDSGFVPVKDASTQTVCYCRPLPSQSSVGEGSVSRMCSDLSVGTMANTPQAIQRNVQPKTSFLDLRLNDISNRSLNDSIWATPTKTSIESDKTPTQRSYRYNQRIKDAKLVQVPHGTLPNEDELCSNQAVRVDKSSLEEMMKAFERKNMGLSPWLEGALQAPQNGFRMRRNPSFPKLRHSVLAWWAGVEQEQATAQEPPTVPQIPSDSEKDSDRSVCEVIQPWDSWSAVVHNLRSANDKNTTRSKTRRIFTNFDPATIVSRTHDVSA